MIRLFLILCGIVCASATCQASELGGTKWAQACQNIKYKAPCTNGVGREDGPCQGCCMWVDPPSQPTRRPTATQSPTNAPTKDTTIYPPKLVAGRCQNPRQLFYCEGIECANAVVEFVDRIAEGATVVIERITATNSQSYQNQGSVSLLLNDLSILELMHLSGTYLYSTSTVQGPFFLTNEDKLEVFKSGYLNIGRLELIGYVFDTQAYNDGEVCY